MRVLVEGREATIEERTRSSIAFQKLAVNAGWETRIGFSRFQDDDKTFKSGAKAGQTVEGKTVDNVWCQGFKEGHIFTVVWHNNKLDHCLYDNRVVSLSALKGML
jgi:hypothetical protein